MKTKTTDKKSDQIMHCKLGNIEVQLYEQPPADWDPLMQDSRKIIQTGSLLIDESAGAVYRNGQPVRMTETEWKILLHLIKNPTVVCKRERLLNLCEFRFNRSLCDNTLSKHINRLRDILKQDDSCSYIETHSTNGYKWSEATKCLFIER